jgi:hypothetical protein
MTNAIKFDQEGKYYPTIHHGDCSEKIPPSMAPPHMVVYRCPWAVRAHSSQWRVLIGTWMTPPTTGTIEFGWGGKYYPTICYGDCSEKNPCYIIGCTLVLI